MPTSAQDLIRLFRTPQLSHSPLPLWWWSGSRLERGRLRWQMEQMLAGGIGQAVVMNLAPTGPLYGSLADDPLYMSEQWWEIFLAVCEDARELGFRLWFYDQIGFSGANFQGGLVVKNSQRAGAALSRTEASGGPGTTVVCPSGNEALRAYAVVSGSTEAPVHVPVVNGTARWDADAAVRLVLIYVVRRGFDYFSTEACGALLDTVHGEFERRAGSWLGSVIIGSFQDELPDMPTWGPQFAASFRKRHGYDLLPLMHHLWEPTEGAEARSVRRDYHGHRAHLAERAFFRPLGKWHERHGLQVGFDQQSPAREGNPVGAVHHYADYVSTHRHFSAPGSDHWGDSKIHSSIAHAKGHGRTWLEGFHSTGWGGTLEETYDWFTAFLRRGATIYDPHAVYYDTVGGWWEWAPPSTCWRQPYWPAYSQLAQAVSRLTAVLEQGVHVCDVAVLFPTATVQSYLTLEGPMDPATEALHAYEALNGHSSWMHETPGVLDRARRDYDVLDASLLGTARVSGNALIVAGEHYPNVVLPACAVVEAQLANLLVDLVDGGGTAVCLGKPLVTGESGEGSPAWDRFAAALADGRITVVDSPEAVPEVLQRGLVRIDADAPYLHRVVDGVHVIALVAHDHRSGTVQPVLGEWTVREDVAAFDSVRMFRELARDGYGFQPVGDRTAEVRVSGLAADDVQVWDPRSGERVRVEAEAVGEDEWRVTVAFSGGSAMLLVVGAGDGNDLPVGGSYHGIEDVTLPSTWTLSASSTADNRWGDLADPRDRGVVPLQVWRLQHGTATSDVPDAEPVSWKPVLAGTGPFVQITGPLSQLPQDPALAEWTDHCYSLSRGIPNDPMHGVWLGPKGMVPEEFLLWPDVRRGDWVGVRTVLPIPEEGLVLAVGAAADRAVLVDGEQVAVDGAGYWTTSPVGSSGPRELILWLRATEDGPLRASFALVRDTVAYRRPEWLVPGDTSVTDSIVEMRCVVEMATVPERSLLQVGSEGTLALQINSVVVARHGGFDPYAGRRDPRVTVHDVQDQLRPGTNVIIARFVDPGTGVALWVDSSLGAGDGPLLSDSRWTCRRDGREVATVLRKEQWRDPRWACLEARPHPLPGSRWLGETDPAGVVVPVVPDTARSGHRTEWLRFPAPAGTVALRLPTTNEVEVRVDGAWLYPDGAGRVQLPRPHAPSEMLYVRLRACDGRREGALLDGPVEVETAPVEVELAPWTDLSLGTLAGAVRYETLIRLDAAEGRRALLDLGEVRGAAEVEINGAPVGVVAWSPYRLDVTGALVGGDNTIAVTVRSTLAGYLQDASPTPGVYPGQERAGLMGPVSLRWEVAG